MRAVLTILLGAYVEGSKKSSAEAGLIAIIQIMVLACMK